MRESKIKFKCAASQCYAGIYHHLLLFNGLLRVRLLNVTAPPGNEERTTSRILGDLCPVIGHQPTGIALQSENSRIPEVHGSLNSRSGQDHGPQLCGLKSPRWRWPPSQGNLSKISQGCILSKKKRPKMKTRPVATPSTAGALTKAGGTFWPVGALQKSGCLPPPNFRRCRCGIWKPVLGLYWLPSASILLTSLTRFIDPQFFIFAPHPPPIPPSPCGNNVILEGANVCMNRHRGKLLVAKHETPERNAIARQVCCTISSI